MEERREFKRVGYDSNIRFNVFKDGCFQDMITQSYNISGGGIGISTNESLATRQNMVVEIMVPGYLKAINAHGEIVWVIDRGKDDSSSAGIKFTKIDSYDRQMILDYVHFG